MVPGATGNRRCRRHAGGGRRRPCVGERHRCAFVARALEQTVLGLEVGARPDASMANPATAHVAVRRSDRAVAGVASAYAEAARHRRAALHVLARLVRKNRGQQVEASLDAQRREAALPMDWAAVAQRHALVVAAAVAANAANEADRREPCRPCELRPAPRRWHSPQSDFPVFGPALPVALRVPALLRLAV